jgi:hypothetical protein
MVLTLTTLTVDHRSDCPIRLETNAMTEKANTALGRDCSVALLYIDHNEANVTTQPFPTQPWVGASVTVANLRVIPNISPKCLMNK